MKETLRQRIEKIEFRYLEEIKFLEIHIKECVKEKEYESAMKFDIRLRTLQSVTKELRKELQNY
jgi:uncharacterized protein (UPF0335 family)